MFIVDNIPKDRSVLPALSAIQGELIVGKNQHNSFGGYSYRNAEDILAAVKPLCAKYQTVLTLQDELVLIGDRYYTKATATLYSLTGNSEISATAYAREELTRAKMAEPQLTGSSSTYARRYALCGLFGITDSTIDPDHPSYANANPPQPQQQPQQQQQQQPQQKPQYKQTQYYHN